MIDAPPIRGGRPRDDNPRLPFSAFAAAVTAIARALDAEEKIAVAAGLLGTIAREADLLVVARWLAGDRRFTPHPTVASTLAIRVYAAISGEEVDEPGSLDQEIFGACRSMAGSAIEAIRMLLEAHARVGLPVVASESLAIDQIVDALTGLARASGSQAKLELLVGLWQSMDPDEIVTLQLLLGRGAVAAGMSDELMAHAIARAFGQPIALVRHALAIDGDAGSTALAARRGTLEAVFVRPMQPIAPMRALALERHVDESGAIRLEGIDDADARELLIEERLPGARAQLHVWPAEEQDDRSIVALVLPSGRDVARALPSLAARLASVPAGAVIDGQLIVVDEEGVALDTTALERAAARAEELEPGEPPLFVGFDLLVEDGLSLLETPLRERRFRLESLAARCALPITRATIAHDRDELERHYVETIARGGLGIVAKRLDGNYEFGRRSGAWRKAPGESETVLAVIRYAAAGPEGRTGPPGELTFGVWLGDGAEARLVNIGRAGVMLEQEELAKLEQRLRRLRGKRFGTNYEIEPRIVCELEYDAIRVSPRTDAGYTIRVAAIRCVRWDLGIDAAATVEAIGERHRRILRRRALDSSVWVPGDS